MVILIDPLIPVYSEQPGFVQAKGALFGAAQGLKALIDSRFDKAVDTLARDVPAGDLPSVPARRRHDEGDERLAHEVFLPPGIEELSFRETVREIRGRAASRRSPVISPDTGSASSILTCVAPMPSMATCR